MTQDFIHLCFKKRVFDQRITIINQIKIILVHFLSEVIQHQIAHFRCGGIEILNMVMIFFSLKIVNIIQLKNPKQNRYILF